MVIISLKPEFEKTSVTFSIHICLFWLVYTRSSLVRISHDLFSTTALTTWTFEQHENVGKIGICVQCTSDRLLFSQHQLSFRTSEPASLKMGSKIAFTTLYT